MLTHVTDGSIQVLQNYQSLWQINISYGEVRNGQFVPKTQQGTRELSTSSRRQSKAGGRSRKTKEVN